MASKGLYANINARKKKGISRSKKNSTISKEAYANMKAGFPKKKKKKGKKYCGHGISSAVYSLALSSTMILK